MNVLNVSVLYFVCFTFSFSLLSMTAHADIYRYLDEDGIVHMTDAPTDNRFKHFMGDLSVGYKIKIGPFNSYSTATGVSNKLAVSGIDSFIRNKTTKDMSVYIGNYGTVKIAKSEAIKLVKKKLIHKYEITVPVTNVSKNNKDIRRSDVTNATNELNSIMLAVKKSCEGAVENRVKSLNALDWSSKDRGWNIDYNNGNRLYRNLFNYYDGGQWVSAAVGCRVDASKYQRNHNVKVVDFEIVSQ